MNLIFLDIDGVLNNLGSAMGLGSTSRHFDPVSVALIDRLCREGRAQIVARRGEEIRQWLSCWRQMADQYKYVILDDDGDMLPGQPFVQTTFEDGFRWRHYIAALRHLDPSHRDCQDRSVILPAS